MKVHILSLFSLFACLGAIAQNQAPVISNVSIDNPWNTGQVIITYDLADNENDDVDVKLLLSNDGGQKFIVSPGTISGDVGFPQQAGTGKEIIWNFDTVSNLADYTIRIVADDRQVPNIQDLVDMVDSTLLRSDLETVSGIRHYQADPTHLEEVKDLIESRFQQAGLATWRHDFLRDGYTGHNIIGDKAGLGEETEVFIIDAHFDSVDDAPGADDNGSGVVGFLEALRVLAPYNFTKTIRFIGFDFEESVGLSGGTYGSRKYVQDILPDYENINGVINFEMIGYYTNDTNSQQVPTGFNILFPTEYAELQTDSFRGNFIINVGDVESEAFELAYDSISAMYVPGLKVTSLTLPNNGIFAPDFRRSDHAHFWDIDVPAVMLTDGANFRNHNYHTPADSVGTLNFTFMSNVVKGAVATLAALAGLQHSSYVDMAINPSSIPESNVDCGIEIFPVPLQQGNQLTINAGDCFGSSGYTLAIMDIQGKVLQAELVTGNAPHTANVDQLSAGVYFMLLENGNNRAVRKVVIE